MQDDDNEQGNEQALLDRLVEQVNTEPEAEKAPAIDPNDLDAVEEAAAAKAVADEDAKVAAAAKPAEEVPVKGADGKDAAAEQPATREQPITIPKPRFDQVAKERDDARAAAAYWKGRADQAVTTPAEKQPDKPTPEQQTEAIEAKRDALAAKVDAGEMLMSDWRREDRKLEAEQHAIREATRQPAARQDQKSASDLYLDAKTEELETAHPYVPLLDGDDLAFLTRKAVASLAAEQIVLKNLPNGDLQPRDQLVLRTRIAELSDQFGPALTGKTLAPRQNPAAKPGLTPQGQNLRTKLQAAQDAPPDLTAAGRGGAPLEYTDAQIVAMSQDELDALPQATLDKIMARQS